MKLTFIYSDHPAQMKGKFSIRKTQWTLPNEILETPNYKEKILALVEMVGQITLAGLHVTCKEPGWQNRRIKDAVGGIPLRNVMGSTIIRFERHYFKMKQHMDIRIYAPIPDLFGGSALYHNLANEYKNKSHLRRSLGSKKKVSTKTLNSLHYRLIRGYEWDGQHSDQKIAVQKIKFIVDTYRDLLNVEQPENKTTWVCLGFHPNWEDKGAEKLHKEFAKSQRERRIKKTSKVIVVENPQHKQYPKKWPQAVPGKFMGIMFRSQLEIRFAAQLVEKEIRWQYEPERLGEANYLVDFYLPTHKCWIEVKGKPDARDNLILPDLAKYLWETRKERLFIYSSRTAFQIQENKFIPIPHVQFWQSIELK